MSEEVRHGLLEGRQITDYIAGANSPLVHEVLVNSGWSDYKPEHEHQFNYASLYDTLMCVSFAQTDALESLMMYHLFNGNISASNVLWLKDNGYFKNGFLNFNERYVAINGKTSSQGAYAFDVINGIRHRGCIPQDMFPFAGNFKDNVNPQFVTEEMYALGDEFARRFPISYEWVDNGDVQEFIKYSPLTASVRYANGDGILSPEGLPNHRVMVYTVKDEWVGVNDSYEEIKKYALDCVFSYMAIYLNVNKNMVFKKEKTNPSVYAINEEKKTKMMIIDMPTLGALDGQFTEVDSLAAYTDNGTLIWTERKIN